MAFWEKINNFFSSLSNYSPDPTSSPPVDVVAMQQKVKVKEKEEQERKERLSKAKQRYIDKLMNIIESVVEKLRNEGIEFKKNPDLWCEYSSASFVRRWSEDILLTDDVHAIGQLSKRKFYITNQKDKFVYLSYGNTPHGDAQFVLFQPSYGKAIMVDWFYSEYVETIHTNWFFRNSQKEYHFEIKSNEFDSADMENELEKQQSNIEKCIRRLVELSIEQNLK